MGTSLTGLKIKDSYSGLLKTSDNGALGASAKQLTDGVGTGSPLYLSTSRLGIGTGASVDSKLHIEEQTANTACVLKVESLSWDSLIELKNGNRTWEIGNDYSDSGALFIYDGTAGSERMRIDSSGNTSMNGILSVNRAAQTNQSTIIQSEGGESYIKAVNGASSVYQALVFKSANNTTTTERMRITSGGYLKASSDGTYNNAAGLNHELVSTGSGTFHSLMIHKGASPYGILINYPSASPNSGTDNQFLTCSDSTTNRLIIWSNGNVVNTNNSYGAISDIKHKENIEDATPKLDDLMKVKIRNFNMIGETNKQIGVVAQELEEVFPSMVSESPDYEQREVELKDENGNIVYETEQVLISEAVEAVIEIVEHEAIAEELDADGNVIVEAQDAWTEEVIVTPAQEAVYETIVTDEPVMTTEKFDLGTTTKSVKYSVFVPMLIKAVQELNAKVESLEAQLNA